RLARRLRERLTQFVGALVGATREEQRLAERQMDEARLLRLRQSREQERARRVVLADREERRGRGHQRADVVRVQVVRREELRDGVARLVDVDEEVALQVTQPV